MAIDPQRLKALVLPEVEQHYHARDAMFHALGVGYHPDAAGELDFVYEKNLKVAPSLALTLCVRSLSTMDLGIDFRKVVHAAHALHVHAPLPSEATLVCRTRIAEVWDLGADKGAQLELDRELRDKANGEHIATSRMTVLCRGDGGFGGEAPPARKATMPTCAADHVFTWKTLPEQAALYRLQGDMNPLHIDPERARSVGFERPILHGLATFSGCVRAVLASVLDHEPARLRSVQGRFIAPFFPGETLRVELWSTGPGAMVFQARSVERDVLVIKDGVATIAC
ncbi:MaoC/PaaZ C-terminal domain-containing protein [Hydrogenophaga sp.]|uniref:MaoC/PaaZ C-terminal domain-containing protein n=1 Tax=Hydrogenophaga sp. TaxID=1904254 RepID=UPI002715791A|nr:MaoC/PaaZ C-terminal domain-containing protein [Hydrogenophaga sp.]MDO9438593.1 MaoC/PaaZ C-terminal domain-containing protein [Hydrogenophaga sp.]